MEVEKALIFDKRQDFVGRLPNGKIVFIKESVECPLYTPAIIKIIKDKKRYAIGELLIAVTRKQLYGNKEIIQVLHETFNLKSDYTFIEDKDTILLFYESIFTSESIRRYVDVKDFCAKVYEIKKIIEYNKKVRQLKTELEQRLKEFDINLKTALLPEDWDFKGGQWKESGLEKIQIRNESVAIKKPDISTTTVKVKIIEYRGFPSRIEESWKYIFKEEVGIIKPYQRLSEFYTSITDILEQHSIMKENDYYIIKRFPYPTCSKTDDTIIVKGIPGAFFSGEDYLMFKKRIKNDKVVYEVYPVVVAESEEEALRKAEEIADGDGTVENIEVEQIYENYWKVTWTVFT